MSRTPNGAPGTVIYVDRAHHKNGSVVYNKQTDRYVAMFDGILLGVFDEPEDAIAATQRECSKFRGKWPLKSVRSASVKP